MCVMDLPIPTPAVQTSQCWHGTHISVIGRRNFAVTGPETWNSLPAELRLSTLSKATFARRLKAHLFVSTEWHVPAARLILLKAALFINIIIIIIGTDSEKKAGQSENIRASTEFMYGRTTWVSWQGTDCKEWKSGSVINSLSSREGMWHLKRKEWGLVDHVFDDKLN